jgi:putative hemolysin
MMDKPMAEPSAEKRLTVRLVETSEELEAVQRLRWQVFFSERDASSDATGQPQCDIDSYDALCDHLLVIDNAAPGGARVVGTYRLLRQSVAERNAGFYTSREFDLGSLMRAVRIERPDSEMLELGRSCVLPAYRTSATINLLWRGIASYLSRHSIGMMFGCASFPGTDPDAHAAALSYLHHHHLAPIWQRPRVRAANGVALERLPRESYDPQRAMLQLPPLIKGYLRVGACVGDGAFVDRAFGSVDVCIVMPVERISERYAQRFRVAA